MLTQWLANPLSSQMWKSGYSPPCPHAPPYSAALDKEQSIKVVGYPLIHFVGAKL